MTRLLTLTPPDNGGYSVICADCPWPYKCWSGSQLPGRAADTHYNTMTIEDIMALPVADMAAEDCVLLMWVTMPLLMTSGEVGKAWGFEYKTDAFNWVKHERNGADYMGMGHWTRANSELCLLFTRGKPKRRAKDVRQVVRTVRGKHSAKPLLMYNRIERLLAGPYLELFARRHKPGWDVWGNEAPDKPETCLAEIGGGEGFQTMMDF